MTHRSLRSVHPFFAQLTLLPNPQNPMFYNAFQLARHPRSVLPMMGIYTHCNTRSLDSPNSAYQTASRSVQPFLHSSRQRVAILQNGPPIFLLKNAPSHGGSGPHLIHGSLGQPESSTETASRSVQPLLQGSLL